MKELVENLVSVAKERINKEQESGFSEETFRLLQIIVQLGVYL